MALFLGMVNSLENGTFEIPVAAKCESSALSYLQKSDEWKLDGGFGGTQDPDEITVVGVRRITKELIHTIPLELTPDILCWGDVDAFGGEASIVDAFTAEMMEELRAKMKRQLVPDEEFTDWDEFPEGDAEKQASELDDAETALQAEYEALFWRSAYHRIKHTRERMK